MEIQKSLLDNDPFNSADMPTVPAIPHIPLHDGYGVQLAVTGHRLNRILEHVMVDGTVKHVPVHSNARSASDYRMAAVNRLQKYVQMTLAEMPRPSVVYCGMADGFDQAVAIACIILKIPYIACLPFAGHTCPDSTLYKQASEVVVVCEGGYHGKQDNWKYIKRDEYMVKQGNCLLSFWNGDSNSGTGKTVAMAEHRIPIWNCWQPWAEVVYGDRRHSQYAIQNSISQRVAESRANRLGKSNAGGSALKVDEPATQSQSADHH